MAISDAAVMRSYDYLTAEGYDVEVLRYLSGVMEIVAVVVVLGVLGLYIMHYLKPLASKLFS